MILIPDIATVLILPPRTASSTLRKAVLARYPNAMQVYRHMEADGIPLGYDTYLRVGLVRNPIDRLWSLYKFLRGFGGDQHDPAFVKTMRDSVDRSFSEWVLHNETVFTSPYDRAGRGRFWPGFCVRHPLPENRKSQAIYLRPDLGTRYFSFDEIGDLAKLLDVELTNRENQTDRAMQLNLTPEARAYIEQVHAWDLRICPQSQNLRAVA